MTQTTCLLDIDSYCEPERLAVSCKTEMTEWFVRGATEGGGGV